MSEPGLIWLPACGSTNDEAMSRIDDLSVRAVGADAQTAGRGRRGRTWASPPGSGLYLSWIARPTFSARLGAVLPLMGAVAVAEVCEDLGLRPTVKWPNDLLVEGRKLAGVLCEARGTATHWHAVVGIGLNLRTPAEGWPADVPAVALDAAGARGPFDAATLAPALVAAVEARLAFAASEGFGAVLAAFSALAPPPGTQFSQAGRTGTYAGLGDDGALLLRDDAGVLHAVRTGEVEIIGAAPT